jgi:Short C-terminal domain
MPSTPPSPGIPGWFIAIFVIVGVCGIGAGIWRFAVLRSGGLNPLVAREQLEARLAQSQLLTPAAPGKSIEQRLAELDDLHARGVITADEHAAARAKVIADT